MARKKLLTEGEIRQFMKLANLRPVSRGRLSEMGYPPGQRDDEMAMGAEEEVAVDDVGGDEMEMELGAEEEMDLGPEEGGGEMVSMDDFMAALEKAIEEVTGEEADVSEEPGGEEEEEVEMDMEMGPEGGEEMEMGAEEEIMAEILRRLREETDAQRMRRKRDKKAESAAEEEKEAKKGSKRKGEQGFGKPYEKEALDERQPRMQTRHDPEHLKPGRGFGAPDPEEEEEYVPTGELEPGTPYGGPEEEEELARSRASRRRSPRRSPTGVGIPAFGMEEQVVSEVAKRVVARLRGETRKEQMVDHLAERIMKRLTK